MGAGGRIAQTPLKNTFLIVLLWYGKKESKEWEGLWKLLKKILSKLNWKSLKVRPI